MDASRMLMWGCLAGWAFFVFTGAGLPFKATSPGGMPPAAGAILGAVFLVVPPYVFCRAVDQCILAARGR